MSSQKGSPIRRHFARVLGRLPWWVALALGVVGVVLGVSITTKPFASLGVLIGLVAASFVVTGVSEIASDRASARWVGGAWIAAGVVVAVWPGLSVRGLAILVGVSLLVGGLLRLLSGLRGDVDERLISFLSGAARAVFGVLALSWPDISLLVTALLIGPSMILFGLGQIAAAFRRRAGDVAPAKPSRSRWPRWLRVVGAVGSLLIAGVLLLVSAIVHRSSSEPGAFYAAPDSVPEAPGMLLRSEPTTRGIPDGARGWKILYTTTRDDSTPALGSALVVVSKDAPSGPRPLIAWAHGTTGFASRCAPSVLPKPFTAGAMPDLEEALDNGWVVVAPDYVGLGTAGPHPYLVGDPEARSVLDGIRAARRFDQVDLDASTIVWGHSQGGGAALWTGVLAPRYAPDAKVTAVAALAPATNLPALFDNVKDSPVGKIMGSYVLNGYSAVYDDVHADDYVAPAARVSMEENASRCLSGPEALVSVLTSVGKEPVFSQSPSAGPLGRRLTENIPTGRIDASLMIAQGLSDALVLPDIQKRYVDGLCVNGQSLEYRTYKGFDHVGVVLDPESPLLPDLIAWTKDRLAGTAPPSGCETVAR